MAQQQHRSEIQVTLNDSAVNTAIRRMVDGFKKVSDASSSAFKQSRRDFDRFWRPLQKGSEYDEQGRARDTKTGRYTARPLNRIELLDRRIDKALKTTTGKALVSTGATTARTLMMGDTASAVRGVGQLGGQALKGIGLGSLAGALPFVGDLAGAVIQRRMSRIGQVAGIERAQTELALSGMSLGGTRSARRQFTALGISASEGLNALRTAQRAIGERSEVFSDRFADSMANRLARLQLRGIDAGTVGQFMRGGAMGGGAMGGTRESIVRIAQIVATAQGMGMTGGGAQRLLSAIASNTQRIASEGLQIDESKMARDIFGISEEARRRGFKQVEGMGAVTAYQRLGGGIGGIMGGFRSQFGGLARGALIASAGRGAQSPLDVMRKLENFRTNPMQAIEAMRAQGIQGDMLRIALSGLGLSLDQAETLMGTREGALSTDNLNRDLPTMRRGMTFNRMIQSREERLMSVVQADPKSANAILGLNESMEKFALSLTNSNGALMTAINDGLKPAIEGLIDVLNTMRGDPLKPLKDLIPF